MLFSVIIPTYKTEIKIVEKSLKSVKNQIETDWELILVDDNPTHSIWKKAVEDLKLKNKDKRIKFIFHERNLGANFARNTGCLNSNGEYLAFLDSDDTWDSDYLSTVKHNIITFNSDVIASNYRVVTKTKIVTPFIKRPISSSIYHELVYEDVVGPTSAVVVKKQAIINAGLFDTSLPARQDYDMWLRISKNNGTFSFVQDTKLSILRIGNPSVSTSGDNTIIGTKMVLSKILNDFTLEDDFDKIKITHYISIARFALGQQKWKICKEYCKKACACNITIQAVFIYFLACVPAIVPLSKKIYQIFKNRIKQ